MKIVIDARLYSQSGVGRYLQELIKNLGKIDKKNQYLIFLTKKDYSSFRPPGKNFQKKLVNISWHSLAEQIFLPFHLIKERPDLVHFPYFSVPILYPGKFVITIHDLIVDHFNTGRASTKNKIIYKLKRFFYKIVIWRAIRRAKMIIAVSYSTKKEIIDHYRVNSKKIKVIYEGVKFSKINPGSKPIIPFPYLLYVGNAYPHKNLEKLIEAFRILKNRFRKLKLVLVGKKDYFYQKMEKSLLVSQKRDILFFGFANDKQLANLYTYAKLFIFPSLMEGFGLPGLEAMACGCPVVCSKIPVFREVYGDAAYYFNPVNPADMAKKITAVLENKKIQENLRKNGFSQIAKYSWLKMAKETIGIYERYSKIVR